MSCPPTGHNDDPAPLGWGCLFLIAIIGLACAAIWGVYHA